MSPAGSGPPPVGGATPLQQIAQLVRRRIEGIEAQIETKELTLFSPPERLLEVLELCRDHPKLSCELLVDVGAVHWPAEPEAVERQPSTTGWPDYRLSREDGVIEVGYVLRSITHHHRFRVSVATDDEDPRLPSATSLYPTANFHEREIYDFFGVEFEGHPNLTRILMPDDWVGHPLRKDYPLGGVDIPYQGGAFIPSPEDRDLRTVVE